MSDADYRMRIRTTDGKPQKANIVKGKNFPYARMYDVAQGNEFVIITKTASQLQKIREMLPRLSFIEIEGSTDVKNPLDIPTSPASVQSPHARQQRQASISLDTPLALKKKPYGFVPVPEQFTGAEPLWHDGSGHDVDRISGEIRFELTTLSPLLVGWVRQTFADLDKSTLPSALKTIPDEKPVLCPLRAPWGKRPVLIPGDSLKGLLRHELGALLGAPMERVAERSYSYRPNLSFPDLPNRRLEPRLAKVLSSQKVSIEGENDEYPMPKELEVYPFLLRNDQKYYPQKGSNDLPPSAKVYRGGMGAGTSLPLTSDLADTPIIRTSLEIKPQRLKKLQESQPPQEKRFTLGKDLAVGYSRTLQHLFDSKAGHFTNRHPHIGDSLGPCQAAIRKAASAAFADNDLIWVEWDTEKKCVVSFGWHYYYRWSYQDLVRRSGAGQHERAILSPLPEEQCDIPTRLSRVRRIFGYANDKANDQSGSPNIGKGEYSQLMGHISINAAIEDVVDTDDNDARFYEYIVLKVLGLPRPSAVEHYVQQPENGEVCRPDLAKLCTYGDAAGYDSPGQLAGRKFYLDRKVEDLRPETWSDTSENNKINPLSTLAVEVSKPGRIFRFTLRFRDMEPLDVAATLLALCPDHYAKHFASSLTDAQGHGEEYCSKLGYARPLGFGSIKIVPHEMFLLDESLPSPQLSKQDLDQWFRKLQKDIVSPTLNEWFAIHRRHHPDSADYPEEDGKIFQYHSHLRQNHSRLRRYARPMADQPKHAR